MCSCQIAEVRRPNCALEPVRPIRPAHQPSASATPRNVLALGERGGDVVGLERDAVLVAVVSRGEHLVVRAGAVDEGRVDPARGGEQSRPGHAGADVEALAEQLRRSQPLFGRCVGAEPAHPVHDAPPFDDGLLLRGFDPCRRPVRGVQERRLERRRRPLRPTAFGRPAAHPPPVGAVRGERLPRVGDESPVRAVHRAARPDDPATGRHLQLEGVLDVVGEPREAGLAGADADRHVQVFDAQVVGGHGSRGQSPAVKRVVSVPMPSISLTSTSSGPMKRGGVRRLPMPAGVPEKMMSPGSSRHTAESRTSSSGTS